MTLPKGNKDVEFIQTSLRSATDIYKEGGHVIQKYKDQKFSLNYDNKRCLISKGTNHSSYKGVKAKDLYDAVSLDFLDSKP